MDINKKEKLKHIFGIAFSTLVLFLIIKMGLFQSADIIILLAKIPAESFLLWHLYIGILHVASVGLDLWLIKVFGDVFGKNIQALRKIRAKEQEGN